MSRIEEAFESSKLLNKPCFIPYLTAGIPNEGHFLDLVAVLRDKGASLLEIGIPFSDPVLDGPVLQKANQLALENGINTPKALELTEGVRRRFPELGILIMSYMNPIYRYGIEDFFRDAKEAGADGVIIPDCPFEESGIWIGQALRHGIDRIFIVTELTDQNRLRKILKRSSGFLYYMTVKGTTGARDRLPQNVIERLAYLKALYKLPIAAGFGISKRSQIELLSNCCDGIIIGSAIMETILYPQNGGVISSLKGFLDRLFE